MLYKPGFHIIVTIVWITLNDSSDHSNPRDLLETRTNDPNDRKDQDRWDRALLYSSDCSDPVNPVMNFNARFLVNQEGRRAHCA